MVVVPLFVDDEGRPDFGWMDTASHDIGKHLTPGTLVIYETTLPVGTTRDRWKPTARGRAAACARARDFHLVFSPERVLTGRVFADLRKYPKLVGGLSAAGAAAAARLLRAGARRSTSGPTSTRGNGVWDLGSAEAAEMAKLAETTYRDVNIGLANQFAVFAEKAGIDVHQVIEASNSQPYSHIHQPGIAVGGHCIPVYPRLYLSGDPDATVVRAAREANAAMPAHVGRPARRAARRPDRPARRGARCGLPRWGEGDGVQRRLRHRPGRCGSAAPCRRSTTRCTPTTSSPRSASQPHHLGDGGRCGRDPDRPRRVRRPPTCRHSRRAGSSSTAVPDCASTSVASRRSSWWASGRRMAGRRLMPEPIHLSKADVTELEEQYVVAAIRSGWCAPLGPDVDAFESEIAELVGVEHALALASGTAALHLALLELGGGRWLSIARWPLWPFRRGGRAGSGAPDLAPRHRGRGDVRRLRGDARARDRGAAGDPGA